MSDLSWQNIAAEARQYRDASIAKVQPAVPKVPEQLPLNVTGIPKTLLAADEVKITESLPEEILARIAKRKLSSEEVARAFLRRASLAQSLTNCITELLPERAIARARQLDEHLSKHGTTVGPLHGLPISVKEHIGFKDLGLNTGFVSWWDRRGKEDALVLRILGKAGAVFFARTAEPQALMHLETSNNLYGVTVNPFNRNLTSGGSSGGEGALLGIRGSCLGLGTDIGGSIRSPAANCGVYGFKPSTHRIPLKGLVSTKRGCEQILSVQGPLSTSLGGIKLFLQTVIASEPWHEEPSLVPLRWRDDLSYFPDGKVKVAIMWHDDVVRPHPPVRRALHSSAKKIGGLFGVELVDWKPYKHAEAWEIISSLYFCDGGAEEIDAIEASGEPQRPLTRFIIEENPFVKYRSIEEIWKLTSRRDGYRAEYAKLWNDTDVDVILCPVGPGVAPPLDHARYWAYTSQWNLLDYPALVFPVSRVDPEIDKPDVDSQPLGEKDLENHKLYQDPLLYASAPVSLQLVGRRYEEEKVSKCNLPIWAYSSSTCHRSFRLLRLSNSGRSKQVSRLQTYRRSYDGAVFDVLCPEILQRDGSERLRQMHSFT